MYTNASMVWAAAVEAMKAAQLAAREARHQPVPKGAEAYAVHCIRIARAEARYVALDEVQAALLEPQTAAEARVVLEEWLAGSSDRAEVEAPKMRRGAAWVYMVDEVATAEGVALATADVRRLLEQVP